MWPAIASILGAIGGTIGSVFSGLFGFKTKQADTLARAMDMIGDMAKSDSNAAMAAALVIASENSSGSWLAANWRPLTACVFVGMVVAKWFGYVPPGISPAEIEMVYTTIQIMIGGYVGGRSFEKIINSINIGKVLQNFIDKKVS